MKALLSAVPRLEDDQPSHSCLKGEIPTPIDIPRGCPFQSRCACANSQCVAERPKSLRQPDGSLVFCHAVEERRLGA